jgi:hypothetical protein
MCENHTMMRKEIIHISLLKKTNTKLFQKRNNKQIYYLFLTRGIGARQPARKCRKSVKERMNNSTNVM